MLQIRSEIEEIKSEIEEINKKKKIVYENLRMAGALFSTNPALDGLEQDFQKLKNHIDGVERYMSTCKQLAYFLFNEIPC